MLANRFAKCRPVRRVKHGDVLRPLRSAQPAHAMGQPRRCKANLCVFETLANFTQHVRTCNAQAGDFNVGMPFSERRID